MKMKIKGIKLNHHNKSNTNNSNGNKNKSAFAGTNTRVILDSLVKLNPRYLAKDNPVMFTVELGFIVVLAIGLFPVNSISSEFVTQNRIFYLESAIILILTVWFATFSESLSEAQARARVDSLKSLEKEVSAHKIVNDDREVTVTSSSLKPGDEVRVNSKGRSC
jgi:potassium-transporting ATPase ATP-binding subunit